LLIIDLVKDTKIAHSETMHVLEITFQLIDMAIYVGISGNDINGIRDPFLQVVVSLPVEFDGISMKKNLTFRLKAPIISTWQPPTVQNISFITPVAAENR